MRTPVYDSSARAASLCQRTLPEILRIPLTDLCLATKLMAPSRQPIAEFLAEAPEPPSFVSTRAAVAALKSMEALDQWEDVTELGRLGHYCILFVFPVTLFPSSVSFSPGFFSI